VDFDYLVIAAEPQLDFAVVPGALSGVLRGC
jgi:hypothetical protein